MTRNALPREFDVARILADYEERISFLERSRYGVTFSEAAGDFTVNAGYTGFNLFAVVSGPIVSWVGWVDPNTDWGPAGTNHNIMNLPPDLSPPQPLAVPASSRSTVVPPPFRIALTATGNMNVRCDIAGHTSGVYLVSLTYSV